MPRKSNTNDNALVSIYERENAKGIRFCLRYSVNCVPHWETLTDIPYVRAEDKQNHREARAKAEAIAFERTKEIREGKLGYSTRNSKLLLKDWFEVCVARAKSHEREDGNRHTWSRTIEFTGEVVEQYRSGVKLVNVDKKFVMGFIDFLKNDYIIGGRLPNTGKHLKPSTAEKKLTAFSYVLKMAVAEGKIVRNPFDQIESADKIHVPESTREYLTEEELRKLADTPINNEATRHVYMFMCFCGLRISDVKRIKWGDIETDGDRWRLRIRQQKTQTPLYLPLSEQAKKFIPERGEKTDDDLVFDNLPSEQTMNRHLKEWAKAAGIKKNLTLHTGRHTFATLSITKGVDVYTTGKLLGHSDIHTTLIYAKIVDEKKVEAVDKLNNILK